MALQGPGDGFGRLEVGELVAMGLADITFTLTPKNGWDVGSGADLVQSSGGFVCTLEKTNLRCNRHHPLLSGLLASRPFLKDKLSALVHTLRQRSRLASRHRTENSRDKSLTNAKNSYAV